MSGGFGTGGAGRPSDGPPPISVGEVTLDMTRRRLGGPTGPSVSLTPLQAAVLGYLMKRAGQVCTRQDLMCEALGYPNPVGSRTIDVHIATLRNKLRGALEIRSVRGVGYALVQPSAVRRERPQSDA